MEYRDDLMIFISSVVPSRTCHIEDDNFFFKYDRNIEESDNLRDFFTEMDEYFESADFKRNFINPIPDNYQYEKITSERCCKMKFLKSIDGSGGAGEALRIYTQFNINNSTLDLDYHQTQRQIHNLFRSKPFARIIFKMTDLWIKNDSQTYGICINILEIQMRDFNFSDDLNRYGIDFSENLGNSDTSNSGVDSDLDSNLDSNLDSGVSVGVTADAGVDSDPRFTKIVSKTIDFKLDSTETKIKFRFNCDDQCKICLEDYVDSDQITILNCEHDLHKNCLDLYLRSGKNVCPICRS